MLDYEKVYKDLLATNEVSQLVGNTRRKLACASWDGKVQFYDGLCHVDHTKHSVSASFNIQSDRIRSWNLKCNSCICGKSHFQKPTILDNQDLKREISNQILDHLGKDIPDRGYTFREFQDCSSFPSWHFHLEAFLRNHHQIVKEILRTEARLTREILWWVGSEDFASKRSDWLRFLKNDNYYIYSKIQSNIHTSKV